MTPKIYVGKSHSVDLFITFLKSLKIFQKSYEIYIKKTWSKRKGQTLCSSAITVKKHS